MFKKLVTVLTILVMAVTIIPAFSTQAEAETASTYIYKTVYGTPKWKTVSTYPSGQPTKGKRFNTGGGFHYSDSAKGSKVSASVNFGGKFGNISISVPFGKVTSTSGDIINVPSSKYYYKLKVTKKVKVKPYIVYKKLRNKSDAKWQVHYRGFVFIDNKVDYNAVRVK